MGITHNSETQQFVFNFEHDGQTDFVRLTGHGHMVDAFSRCFYYGHEFADQVDTQYAAFSSRDDAY